MHMELSRFDMIWSFHVCSDVRWRQSESTRGVVESSASSNSATSLGEIWSKGFGIPGLGLMMMGP